MGCLCVLFCVCFFVLVLGLGFKGMFCKYGLCVWCQGCDFVGA